MAPFHRGCALYFEYFRVSGREEGRLALKNSMRLFSSMFEFGPVNGLVEGSRRTRMEFVISYDMRAPDFGAPPRTLYAAALDQVAWARTNLYFDTSSRRA